MKTARQPWFKRLATGGHFRKLWYKRHVHRKNRKKLRQSDPQEHVDKPLNPWNLD